MKRGLYGPVCDRRSAPLAWGPISPWTFFPAWEGYLPKLGSQLAQAHQPGGYRGAGWATPAGRLSLSDTAADFAFIQSHARPEMAAERQPRLLVDHDPQDGDSFCADHGFDTLAHSAQQRLHSWAIRPCAAPAAGPLTMRPAQGEKLMAREAGRLRMSRCRRRGTRRAKSRFLHYPPRLPRRYAAQRWWMLLVRSYGVTRLLLWAPARQHPSGCAVQGHGGMESPYRLDLGRSDWRFCPCESGNSHEKTENPQFSLGNRL